MKVASQMPLSSSDDGWRGDAAEIERAAAVLRAGGLVAFPTETVYGLGADAENRGAVTRIFEVKGRPSSHPLIVHIGSAARLEDWAESVPPTARLLAERFWPGPLTLVLRRGRRVPLEVTGGLDTVAVRVPSHQTALALLSSFAGGVAAPSANRFGSISPTLARHVREDLGTRVDLVLDGGACDVGVESTIVDLTREEPKILRPGGVAREDLERALGRPLPADATGAVRAPGQHPSHYAPQARLLLVDPAEIAGEARRQRGAGRRVGVLVPAALTSAGAVGDVVIAVPESAMAYAQRLYQILRELDERGCDVIVASLPSRDGLGLAVTDRLQRAAGPRASRLRADEPRDTGVGVTPERP